MKNKIISILSPALTLTNLGDKVIHMYCNQILEERIKYDFRFESSTKYINQVTRKNIKNSRFTIIYGSNLLDHKFHLFGTNQFSLRPFDYFTLENIIFMGVGFRIYSKRTTTLVKLMYRNLFRNPKYIHSVRDSYTQKKLNEIGINNVIMTSCPTLWNLPEIINNKFKFEKVLVTLTDYNKDIYYDSLMLKQIFEIYREVYFLPCSAKDLEYFNILLNDIDTKNINITILKSSLNVLDNVIKNHNIDYIGTRLHIGIYCLNKDVPTRIISIDNRAFEIHKDTNIPIIKRQDILNLKKIILCDLNIKINLPKKSIQTWLEQFTNI
jgi:polysaccharide pyruvyl transferase WcaK-like protein